MRDISEKLNINLNREADAQDYLHNNGANIRFLEDQIKKMELKLSQKQIEFANIKKEVFESEEIIARWNDSRLSLNFR
jgi:GTP cyclohydrolase FolE2